MPALTRKKKSTFDKMTPEEVQRLLRIYAKQQKSPGSRASAILNPKSERDIEGLRELIAEQEPWDLPITLAQEVAEVAPTAMMFMPGVGAVGQGGLALLDKAIEESGVTKALTPSQKVRNYLKEIQARDAYLNENRHLLEDWDFLPPTPYPDTVTEFTPERITPTFPGEVSKPNQLGLADYPEEVATGIGLLIAALLGKKYGGPFVKKLLTPKAISALEEGAVAAEKTGIASKIWKGVSKPVSKLASKTAEAAKAHPIITTLVTGGPVGYGLYKGTEAAWRAVGLPLSEDVLAEEARKQAIEKETGLNLQSAEAREHLRRQREVQPLIDARENAARMSEARINANTRAMENRRMVSAPMLSAPQMAEASASTWLEAAGAAIRANQNAAMQAWNSAGDVPPQLLGGY